VCCSPLETRTRWKPKAETADNCCSILQCGAGCCRVLQGVEGVAACCSNLQCVAAR